MKMSHSMRHGVIAPYKCPCCDATIQAHGDKSPSTSSRMAWQKTHWAHKHGCCVPMKCLSWDRMIPDLLHVNLRIVSLLYYWTAQVHCHSTDEVLALRDWMKDKLGVVVNSKKRLSKNIDTAQIMKKKESFIGEECLKLLDRYPTLIDHIFDDLREGKATREKGIALKLWEAYRDLWVSLTTSIPGENGIAQAPPSRIDKDNKAKQVKRLAKKFLNAFVKSSGQASHATFYVHVIIGHISEFVAMYGNLMYYSAQGAEHLHRITKDYAKGASSKQKSSRLAEIGEGVMRFEKAKEIFPSPFKKPRLGNNNEASEDRKRPNFMGSYNLPD